MTLDEITKDEVVWLAKIDDDSLYLYDYSDIRKIADIAHDLYREAYRTNDPMREKYNRLVRECERHELERILGRPLARTMGVAR